MLIRKVTKLLVIGALIVMPVFAYAQKPFAKTLQGLKDTGQPAGFDTSVTETTLASTIGNIVQSILALLGIIFSILIVYAGILWMTAAGDEGTVTKSKDIIRNSIIGLGIVLAAYAITDFVFDALETSVQGTNQPGN